MGHRPRLTGGGAGNTVLPAPTGAIRTYWRLTDSVTACIAFGRVIILDVARDRYFAPSGAAEAAFARWLQKGGKPTGACRTSLVDLGIVSDCSVGAIRPTAILVTMPVAMDPDPVPTAPVTLSALWGILRCLCPAWFDVRSRNLERALERVQRPVCGQRARTGSLGARLGTFRSARPFLPIPRVCLHDSLALMSWVRPVADVELIIGVSPYPFNAHCWLQASGRAIDDHPQSPSRFHPILRLP